MQGYSRREILRLGAALAAGLGLGKEDGAALAVGLDRIARHQQRVLWLQGLSCTGCSISLLNSDYPGPLELLTQIISLVYHSNLSAAQGGQVEEVMERAKREGDFLLVLEGAIPVKMPEACVLGEKPLSELLPDLLRSAKAVVGVGTCAAFGGVPAAEGNPTGAVGLREFMDQQKIPVEKRLLNCPGCPVHPQSIIGTVAYLAAKGYPPVDAKLLTPDMFYKSSVHDECPRYHYYQKEFFAEHFGEEGCLFKLGCLGPLSHTNCPRRQWNGGVNWCIRAGAPCVACTSEHFARDKAFPFYREHEQQLVTTSKDK
jgi:hydrogenase small subunit